MDNLNASCRIIVGVKYCFRYNQRNRQRLQNDENGEPIDLTTMPRAHRRRREKKLMTMDEVNERFPLTKYKAWMTSRAEEGLPTAGGVAGPTSRAPSMKNVEAVVAPYQDVAQAGDIARPSTAASSANRDSKEAPEEAQSQATHPASYRPDGETKDKSQIHEKETVVGDHLEVVTSQEAHEEDETYDDDQIQMAVPTEMLATPGDSCAICLDTLENDDDIRGLTCGHAFHASCLDPWLTSRRACCPLCKADYYVPKPRTEADVAAEADRHAGRRPPGMSGARIDMVAPPQYAFMGGRGGAPFRPRMILPGRFMTISRAEAHDRYGFPTVQRQPRTSTDPANPISNSWRSRLPTFTNPIPNINLSSRFRRNDPIGGNGTNDRSPEIGTSTSNPTPGQLESGSH